MGLHQGSCVRAPYTTWFTTAGTKVHGDSHCYQPPDVAVCVWHELDYRIDICRVTKGGLIEHL